MVEPFSMGAVGAVAVTEGIKFLYGQAAEVLKRWRDHKAGKVAEAQEPIQIKPTEVTGILEGTLEAPKVDFAVLDRLHDDIRQLAGVLGSFATGLDEPDPSDHDLASAADGLRRALEAVYGQRITFAGEARPPSGPFVAGEANVDDVLGYVAGLRARRIIGGSVTGRVTAKRVGPGGQAIGLEVDTIGPEVPRAPG